MKNNIFWRNVATQGAVGYGQAPGTVATIMMIPLVFFMGSLQLNPTHYAILAAVFVIFGWYVARCALPFFEEKDPSMIVIDEMVSFIALFCFIPVTVKTIILGFIFFRIFDIFKPFGIAYFEELPGAAGIMLDDLAAALLANFAIRFILYMF